MKYRRRTGPSDGRDIQHCKHRQARSGGHRLSRCGQADVVSWGTASGLLRYRCKACGRTFNALTRTPLAMLRMKEK